MKKGGFYYLKKKLKVCLIWTISIFVIAFLAASLPAKAAGPAWWNTDYSNRRQLTIQAGGAALPAGWTVEIAVSFSAGQVLQANGDDIRLYDHTAGAEINREILGATNITSTTLDGDLTDSAADIKLNSSAGFARYGGAAQIGNEIVIYDEADLDGLRAVRRGASGTVAAVHNSGVAVKALTLIRFKLPAQINAGQESGERYFLYSGNANPPAPLADLTQVYTFYNDLSDAPAGWTQAQGVWTKGSRTLPGVIPSVRNPIFGAANDSDSNPEDSDLYKEGDTYYLYYHSRPLASTPEDNKIFVATSTDLKAWTRSGILLQKGGAGEWDDYSVYAPRVIKSDATYYMFYTGAAGPGGGALNQQIGLATANNPLGPWTKSPANPVISVGAGGQWDDQEVAGTSKPIWSGGEWKMLYTGIAEWPPVNRKLGLATSPDLITWTKSGGNPVLVAGEGGVEGAGVFQRDNLFYLSTTYLGGAGQDRFYVRLYRSADWITWTEEDSSPILGPYAPWNKTRVGVLSPLVDGDRVLMSFYGWDGTQFAMGLASMPLASWERGTYNTLNVTLAGAGTALIYRTGLDLADGLEFKALISSDYETRVGMLAHRVDTTKHYLFQFDHTLAADRFLLARNNDNSSGWTQLVADGEQRIFGAGDVSPYMLRVAGGQLEGRYLNEVVASVADANYNHGSIGFFHWFTGTAQFMDPKVRLWRTQGDPAVQIGATQILGGNTTSTPSSGNATPTSSNGLDLSKVKELPQTGGD